MEHYNLRIYRGRRPTFDEVPADFRRRVFGVDYVAIRGMQGGEFFFTRAGWVRAQALLPRVWYDNQRFCRVGKALPKATGSVYLMPVPHPARKTVGLLVKFCRFAQDVGCTQIDASLQPAEVAARIFGAEFASPFEEFGRVMHLRAQWRSDGSRFRTKVPLAIYCPPTRYLGWQLGRDESRLAMYDYALAAEQADQPGKHRIVHHWDRLYVMLYQWIEGVDLEEAARNGLLSETEMRDATTEGARDLLEAGYAVMDHKARHLVVRPDLRTGRLRRRHGKLVYALIDYELLVPMR